MAPTSLATDSSLRRRSLLARAAAILALLCAAGPAARAATLTLSQEPVVLGRVESVEVTVRVEEPPGTEAVPLRLSVNVGSFGEVSRVEPGVYKSIYTPPSTRFPQVALVAAWRETGPDAPIDFLRIPLWGTTRIDALAPQGSEVRVEIGAASFGPVVSNAKGAASVPVDVPPGVPEAIIRIADRGGQTISRRAAISVPAYNRLTVALVPQAILSNGDDWARVEVYYDSPQSVAPQHIGLSPTEGTVTLLRTEAGRFVYKYVAPAGSLSREVGFTVQVAGDAAAKGAANLSLGLPPPAEIAVSPPATPLQCDGRAWAPVQVRVWDARRVGLPHQHVEVLANGQRIKEVEYKGGGLYEARYVAPAGYPDNGLVRFLATVVRPDGQGVTASANYQVLPLPLPFSMAGTVSPSPVPADGTSRAIISLDVRDHAGLPLKGARLIALASHGTAGPVLELGEGRYRIDYLAPAEVPPGYEALVKIVDASNTFETHLPVPLRREQHVLLGVRGGWGDALGPLAGPRGGLELFVPVRLAGASFGVGATATVGAASQTVNEKSFPVAMMDASESTSEALFVPLSLRVSWAPLVSSRLALYVGGGGQLTWARVRNDVNGYDAVAVGLGGLGFVSGVLNLGPGQAFVEASYGLAPVEHSDFRLDAGGLDVSVGYRFGLF